MDVIKIVKIELIFFGLIFINNFASYNLDVDLYVYFSSLHYGSGVNYLEEFFNKITELGDSLWYFLLFIFCMLFLFLLKKSKLIN